MSVFVGAADLRGGRLTVTSRAKLLAWARLQKDGPYTVTIEAGESKTRLQECGFHAMISPWAKAEGLQIDDLKRDLLREVFGEREHVNRITGEVVMVLREPYTSKLSRSKYSELIERSLIIAAECGHILQYPHEYREWKAKQAARRRQRTHETTATIAANA